MENRFGVKDFFLLLLLSVLILSVWLSMKQYDRQWEVMQSLQKQSSQQLEELAKIDRFLSAGRLNVSSAAAPSPQSAQDIKAFDRIKAAEAMPGYAVGDWLVDSIPNTDKITPLVSGDVYAADIQGRVLETLLTRDPVTLDWAPLLAKSYQISPDGLTIIFQLRQGITFSDGEPFTADDVVFTFDWIMNPQVAAPRERSSDDKIAKVTKNGDYEVVFQFKEPYFDSLGLAGSMQILPKHFYNRYTPAKFNDSTGLLLGTGPYRLEDPAGWAPGKPLELIRNERYWGSPAPFNRLVYKQIDNDLARLTTFINGELDTLGCTPDQYQKLLKDQTLVSRTEHFEYDTPTSGYGFVAWNEKRDGKPTRFADSRVRQAMTLLADRDRICKQILLGYARTISGPFYFASKQSDPEVKPWPFDPAKARALLKDAGFVDRTGSGILTGPDGQPFRFKLTYPNGSATYDQIAYFLKDSFAAAGIVMEPDPLEWSVFSERLKDHDFDAIALGWSGDVENDIYQMFDSSQIADGGDDFMSYANPALDKAIELARSTVDEAKRMPLWQKCHRILHEDQPYTFLFSRKSLVFLDKRIHNLQVTPLGLNDLTEWYVPADQRKWAK